MSVPQTVVNRYRIIGTDIYVYAVYAYADGKAWRDYSTHQTFDGRSYGRVGTRRIGPDIEAMAGDERIAAAHAHSAAQYDEAYAAIVAHYPEAAGGHRSMGQITVAEAQ